MPSWRTLLLQEVSRACARALNNEGSKSAAKTAMIAITTNNSTSVKAILDCNRIVCDRKTTGKTYPNDTVHASRFHLTSG